MPRVFVFGSLLDAEVRQMIIGRPVPAVAFTLSDHELAFRGGLPVADPAIGSVLPGAVIEVSEDELRDLDRFEAIDHGLYRRDALPSGEFIYRFNGSWPRREPQAWALNATRAGRRQLNLPTDDLEAYA